MNGTVNSLIVDLLEFVAREERTYDEVIDAWHTSCPKLPVWEEATERGLVARVSESGRAIIKITSAGRAVLDRGRQSPVH